MSLAAGSYRGRREKLGIGAEGEMVGKGKVRLNLDICLALRRITPLNFCQISIDFNHDVLHR